MCEERRAQGCQEQGCQERHPGDSAVGLHAVGCERKSTHPHTHTPHTPLASTLLASTPVLVVLVHSRLIPAGLWRVACACVCSVCAAPAAASTTGGVCAEGGGCVRRGRGAPGGKACRRAISKDSRPSSPESRPPSRLPGFDCMANTCTRTPITPTITVEHRACTYMAI